MRMIKPRSPKPKLPKSMASKIKMPKVKGVINPLKLPKY